MAVKPGKQVGRSWRKVVRNVLERRPVHFLLITSAATLLAVLIHIPQVDQGKYLDPLKYLDNYGLDHYFSFRHQPAPEQVAQDIEHTKPIVLIETSHQLPRPLLAKVLQKLRLAKVVAIDMMFVDNEAELEDDEKEYFADDIKAWRNDTDVLARTMKKMGNVVVGSWPEQIRWTGGGAQGPAGQVEAEKQNPAQVKATTLTDIWQKPSPGLWNNARMRGHFLVELGRWDQVAREVELFKTVKFWTRQKGVWRENPPVRVPCLGLATAAVALGITPQQLQKLEVRNGHLQLGPHRIPVNSQGRMLIDYIGDRRTFESDANHRSYRMLLPPPKGEEFAFRDDEKDFKDKIVIIGESSIKSKEIMGTPYGEMPGMQIHANVVATLLSPQGPPRPLAVGYTAAVALACTLLLILPLVRLPLWGSLLFAGLQIFVIFLLGGWVFVTWHRVLPVSVPVMAIAFTYNAIALYEYRRARHTLGKFIGHEMVAETMNILSRPKLGGRRGEASAFFCDLRGFSMLSSLMSPEAVSNLINSYTDTLVNVVKKYGGRPIDYQGDGVFVLFERAQAGAEFPLNAVRAALEMQDEFQALRQQWVEAGAPLLEIGIGIDTGELIIGAVGGEQHLKMGAVGEAVNMAARVQGLNQKCGYTVLVTRKTYDLVQHMVVATNCGFHPVRGHEKPVEVFGVESVMARSKSGGR